MKTTVDIPEQELAKIMKSTGAATKREAILIAIRKFNRRIELNDLNKSLKGQFKDFMNHNDLMRMREMSKPDPVE